MRDQTGGYDYLLDDAVLQKHGTSQLQQAFSRLSQHLALNATAPQLDNESHNGVGLTGFEALLLACLSLGGVLHGVGMAVRKHAGSGHSTWESLAQWQWWTGALVDAVGGILIWPAMPYISVNLIMPCVVVLQLGVAYCIGCYYFKEPTSASSHAGLVLAIIGVLGLSTSNPSHAAHFSMDLFWAHWVQTPFIVASGICILTIVGAYFLAHTSTFWALSAAATEAVQFICSRALVGTALTGEIAQSGTIGAAVMKCICVVAILVFQHWGFQSDLSRFSGVFLAGGTLLICTLGTIYFGDTVVLSKAFLISSTSALIGIWLLNEAVPSKDDDRMPQVAECREVQPQQAQQ